VVHKCTVQRENIPGYALERRGKKGLKKKVLSENNISSALPRSVADALSSVVVIMGYLPDRMGVNPLFDQNLMERHNFNPYSHIPSEIGHDALLGICRK
jgi:hypothetical protein